MSENQVGDEPILLSVRSIPTGEDNPLFDSISRLRDPPVNRISKRSTPIEQLSTLKRQDRFLSENESSFTNLKTPEDHLNQPSTSKLTKEATDQKTTLDQLKPTLVDDSSEKADTALSPGEIGLTRKLSRRNKSVESNCKESAVVREHFYKAEPTCTIKRCVLMTIALLIVFCILSGIIGIIFVQALFQHEVIGRIFPIVDEKEAEPSGGVVDYADQLREFDYLLTTLASTTENDLFSTTFPTTLDTLDDLTDTNSMSTQTPSSTSTVQFEETTISIQFDAATTTSVPVSILEDPKPTLPAGLRAFSDLLAMLRLPRPLRRITGV